MFSSHLPRNCKCSALYLRPKKNFLNQDIWYCDLPVGVNKLQSVVKDLCKAGLVRFYTNRSLRDTSATRMFNNGIDEQVISEVTGHHSLSVHSYKRMNSAQKRKTSEVLFQDRVIGHEFAPKCYKK